MPARPLHGAAIVLVKPIVSLRIFSLVAVCLFALAEASAAPPANSLIQQAVQAETNGEYKRAYLLWAQAAVLNPELWTKAKKLERYITSPVDVATAGPMAKEELVDATLTGTISRNDMEEASRLGEPVHLKPFPGRRSFHLRGDVKTLYERVTAEFGYMLILDRDLTNAPPTPLRFDIDDANYDTALHLLEAATNTFVVPVTPTAVLAAADTTQKRNELEPSAVQMFPIPERSSVQEAQEILMAIQQSLEIRRAVLDPGKRMILLRGPYSRVLVAGALLKQLVGYKPQVSVEVELLTFAENKSRSWGLGLMMSSNLVDFGQFLSNVSFANPGTIATFLTFGGGSTFIGLGLTAASLFATATEGESRSLLKSQIVVVDGQAATFHVGDKYPIVTSQFSGASGLGAFPSVTFEDLGLVLKVTPAIHSQEEVSLDIDAEFKALDGTGANGVPIIGDKKFQSKLRLNTTDWVVVAGLLSRTDADGITGFPGVIHLPIIGKILSSNTKSHDFSEALILIKVKVLSDTPGDKIASPIWVGSDTRWRTVL